MGYFMKRKPIQTLIVLVNRENTQRKYFTHLSMNLISILTKRLTIHRCRNDKMRFKYRQTNRF